MNKKLKEAIKYYDRFAKVYDFFSPKWYYHNARKYAIQQMALKEGSTVLNVPCGTGQNFEYFQKYMNNTGLIIGIDLSEGMLEKAKEIENKNDWKNIQIIKKMLQKLIPHGSQHTTTKRLKRMLSFVI